MMTMMISQRKNTRSQRKKNTRNTLKTKFIKPKAVTIMYKQKANKMKIKAIRRQNVYKKYH